ncbi:MAG TPA: mannosyltransferase family protein [Ktedonobacterales bacterium]|nr:mannosyltransferase family protein [Ktedonobacterales bacterium]
MAQLRNFRAGFRASWHFATSSPEAGISEKLSGFSFIKSTDRAGRRRSFSQFYKRHYLILRALLLTLVWEVVAEVIGILAFIIFPPTNDIAAFLPGQHSPLLSIWARWDSVWYLMIAGQGYGPKIGILQAFFPAYPGLIHVVSAALGGNTLLAGVLINRVLLLAAVAIFTQLVREEAGDRAAMSAPLFFLLVPAAVFFLAAYTETLFLLACVGCFLAARHKRWALAGLCCAVATATRLPGVILAGALVIEGFEHRQFWRGLGAATLGMAGLVAYALYLAVLYRDPLAFQHAYQYGWGGRHFTLALWVGPQQYISALAGSWPWTDRGMITFWSCLAALVIDVLLLALMWRSLRWSYRLFVLGNMALPLCSATLFAYNRYSLVLFPFLLVACCWTQKRPTLREGALLTMGGFSVLNIVLFAASYWVG